MARPGGIQTGQHLRGGPFSRGGAELLFQIFADRYERASILVTSNLVFSDWGSIFQGERMTAALLEPRLPSALLGDYTRTQVHPIPAPIRIPFAFASLFPSNDTAMEHAPLPRKRPSPRPT